MDFETTDLERQVNTQTMMDPSGETQKPLPTYMEQVKNAFQQERLVDNATSEWNQVQNYYETSIKDIQAPDEDKNLIMNYVKHGRQYEDSIRQLLEDGEIIVTNGNAQPQTDKAKKLFSKMMIGGAMPNFQIEGYLKAKEYGVTYTDTKDTIDKNTREKYLGYEKQLQKDPFFTNFGSQLIGSISGWFSDPVNWSTLIGEVGALKLINPLFKLTRAGHSLDAFLVEHHAAAVLSKVTEPEAKAMGEEIVKMFGEELIKRAPEAFKTKAMIGTGVEAIAATSGEAYRQDKLFGFKHDVLPEYTVYDRDLQIGLVGLTGGIGGAVSGALSSKIERQMVEAYVEGAKASQLEELVPLAPAAVIESMQGGIRKDEKVAVKTEIPEYIEKMDTEDLIRETDNLDNIFDELKACMVK